MRSDASCRGQIPHVAQGSSNSQRSGGRCSRPGGGPRGGLGGYRSTSKNLSSSSGSKDKSPSCKNSSSNGTSKSRSSGNGSLANLSNSSSVLRAVSRALMPAMLL